MPVFRCKMCGGTIELEQGATVGVCDYCGTKQTLPRLDDERRANLYDRANHFRRDNEFDKAEGIYEQILSEDNTDAEAYWSLVLCRYGVEYVEDPATRKRVPTVNRTQFTSIFDDDDYRSAYQYADGYQREIYKEEAARIDEIQREILAISQKEDPFDVFICYKETDAGGRRTPDSALANDLYHQLTQEGFKVFFSRITLEDKLGIAYEPYIFAALNSAKVMVVIGTKPEYFNAVWVKNEWSRFLMMAKQCGGEKVLIPAYKNMESYDLPDEFARLQAQDMSKIGFLQDLIRGIKKIVQPGERNEPKRDVREPAAADDDAPGVKPLLERAFIFLEDGDWESAYKYCEKVLDRDPKNARAYLGKLLAELHISRPEDLAEYKEPFANNNNYRKILRFGRGEMKSHVAGINERNIEEIYKNAVEAMNVAKTSSTYESAAKSFRKIPGFENADSLAEECLAHAKVCRKDEIYALAKSTMEENTSGKLAEYERARLLFQIIPDWKDANKRRLVCQREIEKLRTIADLTSGAITDKDSLRSCLGCLVFIVLALFAYVLYLIATS